MADDFNFVLKYGFEARDILNTYEYNYTKNMVMNDDETIEMFLSDEEMKAILRQIERPKYFRLSRKCECNSMCRPS